MTINWEDVVESPSLNPREPMPEHLRAARDTVNAVHFTEKLKAKGFNLDRILDAVKANYPSNVNLAVYLLRWDGLNEEESAPRSIDVGQFHAVNCLTGVGRASE
jgi:hypothetical protein